MTSNNSIQEQPSFEASEANTPLKPRKMNMRGRFLKIEMQEKSSLSSPRSNHSSPQLKRCSILYPKDKPKLSNLQHRLEEILKKPDRTLNEAILVYKHLKGFPFFKKFKEENSNLQTIDALLYLCKILKFEAFPSGSTIYRKGDNNNKKIYLVLTGDVKLENDKVRDGLLDPNLVGGGSLKKGKTVRSLTNINTTEETETTTKERQSRRKEKTIVKPNRGLTRIGLTHTESMLIGKKNNSQGILIKDGVAPQCLLRPKNTEISSGDGEDEFVCSLSSLETNQLITFSRREGDAVKGGDKEQENLPKMRKITRRNRGVSMPLQEDRNLCLQLDHLTQPVSKSILKKTSTRKPTTEDDKHIIEDRKVNSISIVFDENVAVIGSKADGSLEIKSRSEYGRSKTEIKTMVKKGSFEMTKSTPHGLENNHTSSNEESNIFTTEGGINQENMSNYLNVSLPLSMKLSQSIKKEKEFEGGDDDFGSLSDIDSDIKRSIEELKDFEDLDKLSPGVDKSKIRRGGCFGNVYYSGAPELKEETATAVEYTKVATFTSDDYEYLLTRYEKTNTKRLNFLLDHVPQLEKVLKYDSLKFVDNFFQEQSLPLHCFATTEGEKGKRLYLLYEGVCQVYKDIFYTESGSKELSTRPDSGETAKRGDRVLVCLIQPGVFIGEEILFSGNKHYEYTVKASSANVKLMAIKKENFKKYLPFKAISDIQTLYLSKKQHHEKMLERKLKVSTSLSFQKKPTIKQLNFGKPLLGKSLTINLSTKTSSRTNGNASRDCSINEDIKDTSIIQQDLTKSMPNFLDNLQTRRLATKEEQEEDFENEEEDEEQGSIAVEEKPQKSKKSNTSRSQRSLTTFAIDIQTNRVISRGQRPPAKEEDINKIKTDFAKYSRKNVLESVFFKDNSVRNNQDQRPDPKENFAIIEKRMENNSQRLPKINNSDINSLKFDFGSNAGDRRSKSKEPIEAKEKSRASSLTANKTLKAIVNHGLPQNSNTILQRISSYSRAESQGSTILRSPSQGSIGQFRISNHTKEVDGPPAAKGFIIQKKTSLPATMKILQSSSANVSPKNGRSPNTSVIFKKKAINLDWQPQPLKLELDGDYPEVGILGRNLPVSCFASPKSNRTIKKKII